MADSLILNPLAPSHHPQEKHTTSKLQLSPCPSKYAHDRRARGQCNGGSKSYSPRAIKDDLAKVTAAWHKMQKARARDAIYDYLAAVYDVVHDWERRGRADRRARRALRRRGLKAPKHPEPYAAVIACTSAADIKARSKWTRALRYFASRPPKGESLKSFMKANGGVNGCASRFARRLGRKS